METFPALLTIWAGNSPVPGELPAQRPVTRSFDIFFDLRPNKRLSKQWWSWWFETPSRPLWRQCNWCPNRRSLRRWRRAIGGWQRHRHCPQNNLFNEAESSIQYRLQVRRPSSELVLAYYTFHHWENIWVKFDTRYVDCHRLKWIWAYWLQTGGYLVLVSVC